MEKSKTTYLAKEDGIEVLPSVIKVTTAHEVAGFDCVIHHDDAEDQLKLSSFHSFSSSDVGTESAAAEGQNKFSHSKITHFVSISMPPSPLGAHLENKKEVPSLDKDVVIAGNDIPNSAATSEKTTKTKFYSQPMPKGSALNETIANGSVSNPPELPLRNPMIYKLKNRPFDPFKTWSGKLERQISNLRGKHPKTVQDVESQHPAEVEALPVDRYFDALQGPESDTLRASEEILLPEDKMWPFLLRYPISSFGICLGVSSQAIMWKTLATSTSMKFLHVSPDANLVLWCISVALVAAVSFIYSLKVIFYFEALRREYYHPIRVNFFFAPWIVLLFLALGVPPSVSQNLHKSLWYILMTPIFCLEIKIYGQWMLGGQEGFLVWPTPPIISQLLGILLGLCSVHPWGSKKGLYFSLLLDWLITQSYL